MSRSRTLNDLVALSGTAAQCTREFRVISEGHYRLIFVELGIEFDIDRLRREHHELIGELTVECRLPGARTIDGILSAADFNVSSLRARKDRAFWLAERSCADELDWKGFIEEFCMRVTAADWTGQAAISLRDLPKPASDDEFAVEGLRLLKRHPVMIFGDGGSAKSYLALFLAGQLAQRGIRLGLFDWELSGEDHRLRLEHLFGPDMPDITYARCDRPLVYEAERLRRLVHDHQLEYVICDSVAFACDGPPEAAEIAGKYFRALRQLDIGSLNIAHITKGENGDQRPFGSTFWHNGSRATWFTKLAEPAIDSSVITIALYPRKANLGPRRGAVGFQFSFGPTWTRVRQVDVAGIADIQDLAAGLPLWQRMTQLLLGGPMTIGALATQLDANTESVEKAVTRGRDKLFTRILGIDGVTKIGLVERRRA